MVLFHYHTEFLEEYDTEFFYSVILSSKSKAFAAHFAGIAHDFQGRFPSYLTAF